MKTPRPPRGLRDFVCLRAALCAVAVGLVSAGVVFGEENEYLGLTAVAASKDGKHGIRRGVRDKLTEAEIVDLAEFVLSL